MMYICHWNRHFDFKWEGSKQHYDLLSCFDGGGGSVVKRLDLWVGLLEEIIN